MTSGRSIDHHFEKLVMVFGLSDLGGWAQPDPSIRRGWAVTAPIDRYRRDAVAATAPARWRELYAVNASGREMRHAANYGKSTTPHTKPRLVERA